MIAESMTVDEARAKLDELIVQEKELRKFLRAHTPQSLTPNEVAVAAAYVEHGDMRTVARHLGIRHAEAGRRLINARRKLGVTPGDLDGLAAALDALGRAA